MAYVLLCVATWPRQRQPIPDKRHSVLDSRTSTNLTLVGFSFAVVGLLVTLFQSDLLRVSHSTFLFSLSLAYFFASYILLYLRLWRAFDTLSEGLTNNGLWAVMAGLRSLFAAFGELQSISLIFSVLLWMLAAYIALDLSFKWQDRSKTE